MLNKKYIIGVFVLFVFIDTVMFWHYFNLKKEIIDNFSRYQDFKTKIEKILFYKNQLDTEKFVNKYKNLCTVENKSYKIIIRCEKLKKESFKKFNNLLNKNINITYLKVKKHNNTVSIKMEIAK